MIVAGFAAGLAATVLVVGIASGTGAFESSHTTTRVIIRPSTIAPVTVTAGAAGFNPGAIYRDRIGGVVTISSVLGGGSEIGGSGFVVSGNGLILTNAHVVTNSATVASASAVQQARTGLGAVPGRQPGVRPRSSATTCSTTSRWCR